MQCLAFDSVHNGCNGTHSVAPEVRRASVQSVKEADRSDSGGYVIQDGIVLVLQVPPAALFATFAPACWPTPSASMSIYSWTPVQI